jgi:hypothetical protein
VVKSYDDTPLSGGADKKGLVVTYSYRGVKDRYDLVADYMSRNFYPAMKRKSDGDGTVTDGTRSTMLFFASGQNPPTPFAEDTAGLWIPYNPDPVPNYAGGKYGELAFPIRSERLNVIATPIKIKP